MPWSSRRGISSRSWSGDLVSETVTRAPWSFRKRAEATPDLPRPTTSTCLSLTSTKVKFYHRGTETQRKADGRFGGSVMLGQIPLSRSSHPPRGSRPHSKALAARHKAGPLQSELEFTILPHMESFAESSPCRLFPHSGSLRRHEAPWEFSSELQRRQCEQ